jgi:hypothetical protein
MNGTSDRILNMGSNIVLTMRRARPTRGNRTMEKIYGILTNLQNIYTAYNETQKYYNLKLHIQGEHKVFP